MTPPAPRTASTPRIPQTRTETADLLERGAAVGCGRDVAGPGEAGRLGDVDDEVDTDLMETLFAGALPSPADPDPDPDQAGVAVDGGLTERERRILAFERQWWKHAGAKEQAIRDGFEMSSTRYYQMVNALLDKPAALAHDPVLVRRLRRLRATRARARTGGRRIA